MNLYLCFHICNGNCFVNVGNPFIFGKYGFYSHPKKFAWFGNENIHYQHSLKKQFRVYSWPDVESLVQLRWGKERDRLPCSSAIRHTHLPGKYENRPDYSPFTHTSVRYIDWGREAFVRKSHIQSCMLYI